MRPPGINFKDFSRSPTTNFTCLVACVDFSQTFARYFRKTYQSGFSKIFQDLEKKFFQRFSLIFVHFSNTTKWTYQRVFEDSWREISRNGSRFSKIFLKSWQIIFKGLIWRFYKDQRKLLRIFPGNFKDFCENFFCYLRIYQVSI